MAEPRIPILTYHGNAINGHDYAHNDLVAFQADLQLIHDMGWRIIKLDELMSWHAGALPDEAVRKAVVLTCDDGTWFDFHDLEHPTWGPQKSLFNAMLAHQQSTGQAVHMTNFVIASPDAREALDRLCQVGLGWWGDDWWQSAHQSGLMMIANHSWDHNHGLFENNNTTDDSFEEINDRASCDRQIRQAQDYLQQMLGGFRCPYFAYPYGNFSDYLRHQYLPETGAELGLKAAFTTGSDYVSRQTERWVMPRFMCNHDWQSTEQLAEILLDAC